MATSNSADLSPASASPARAPEGGSAQQDYAAVNALLRAFGATVSARRRRPPGEARSPL